MSNADELFDRNKAINNQSMAYYEAKARADFARFNDQNIAQAAAIREGRGRYLNYRQQRTRDREASPS